MSYDLADLVPLTVTTHDVNGNPADGGTVVLTITLPDNTTVTPAVTHSGTGVYQVDYPPTMAGRHVASWAGTGINQSGYVEVFDVRSATPPYLVSLTDTKRQLGITATTSDEELRSYIEAATAAVERHLDKAVVRRTVVEKRDLGMPPVYGAPGILQHFTLAKIPVLSLTSIVSENGTLTWSPSDMRVGPDGVVKVLRGAIVWGPVIFTYEAGMTLIPADYSLAAEYIIQHLWETKRGSRGVPRAGGMDMAPGVGSAGYAIPNRALELLGPGPGGFA